MSSPARFTAAQKKSLKHSLFIASADLNHALQPLMHQLICCDVAKEKILKLVGITAQRSLYLTVTDIAAGFDIDLPEHNEAAGTVPRRLVDREAVRCASRLYQDTLVP